MLGRCQHALHRKVLAGLQQHQQQCLQLEVLGLNAARTFFNDYKFAKKSSRKVRDMQRRRAAVAKVLSNMQQSVSGTSHSSSSLLPASAAAAVAEAVPAAGESSQAAVAAAGDKSPTAQIQQPAAAAATSAGRSASPLQAVPHIPRSTSAQPTAAAAAAAADAPKKTWKPTWLSNILDMPNRRRDATPKLGKSSPLQDTAPDAAAVSAEGQQEEPDGWESLNESKNMSLDYYMRSIKQEEGEQVGGPPTPQKPLLGPRSTYSSRLDRKRVSYYRCEQHCNLITMMTEADKKLIQEDAQGVKKDKETLSRIARTAGLHEAAVVDVINRYTYLREYYDLLREYRDAGNKMPHISDNTAVFDLHQRLKDEKVKEELNAVLKYRDPENCKLRVWSHMTGPNRSCPRTNLPYSLCCGDLRGGKQKANNKGFKKMKGAARG